MASHDQTSSEVGYDWVGTSSTEDDLDSVEPDRDSLRKALRDLEAAEVRVLRNAERVSEEARGALVIELLPVLDDLDRTIEAAQASTASALLEGVRMVRAGFEAVLVRFGAKRIDATGQRFDPAIHESVTAVPVRDPVQDMMVVNQLAPGYRLGDRLLRPAKVAVAVYRD
jgi:molecular chaperone GrpE